MLVETFRPGVTDRLGIGFDALHARNPRLVYASCPAYPEGHRWADRPGYDALVQASSGQQWEQPGWRMGPIFLHVPMPSMAAMFLVPTGILAALVAREETGRGQHVRTSLFQGAMLFTTQIWTYIEHARADFYGTMAKSYPPGVHQEMIFEVADDEWVHTSIMSGLAPIKSQDEIVGVPGASDPSRYPMLSAEERAQITPLRRAGYKAREREELIEEFRANNHAIEAIDTMEAALGANGAPHAQLVANDMIATVDDPVLGKTTQVGVPIHLHGHAGRDPGAATRARAAQRRDLRRARLLGRRDPPVHAATEVQLMHALEGVVVVDFGQYLAGPFGPMILGDLGADVIKVEPVTGDGMRMVNQPFIGCSRGKRDIGLNIKSRARARRSRSARRAGRHRAPQHDRRASRSGSASVRRLQARQPRRRVLQHVGVRPRGTARALRRARPAVPGGGRARVRGGPGARGQQAALLPLRDDRHRQRDAVGRRVPRRAVPPAPDRRGPGAVDVAARRRRDARRPTRCSSTATPCRGPELDADQTGIDACYRLYRDARRLDPDRGGRSEHEFAALCAGARRCPSCVDDARFADARRARRAPPAARGAASRRAFATRTAIVWSRAARRRRRAERDPARHATPARTCSSTPTTSGSASSPSTSTRSSAACASSATLIDFSETPGRIAGPPPLVGEHTKDDPRLARLRRRADAGAQGRRRRVLARRELANYPWTV